MGLASEHTGCDLWLHAASVGETKVIGYLVDYLLDRRPGLRIHLTAMTSAGRAAALSSVGEKVSVGYFPFDTPAVMRRTIGNFRPRVMVVAETEIWPNLICELRNRAVPLVLVNGRMSDRAFRRYRMLRGLITPLMQCYTRCFFKTALDRQRFERLALPHERGVIAGDMKFDAPLPQRDPTTVATLRGQLGLKPGDFLLVAGSTRTGEEEILLRIYRRLASRHENFFLLIAPRHVERCPELEMLFRESGQEFAIHGQGQARVILVDRLGILNELYMAADLAFVGGTLVDIGGHNLLEPVWAGTPVLFGPSLHNVRDAAVYILENDYGAQVSDEIELESEIEARLTGRRQFAVKRDHASSLSATVKAGDYILGLLGDG